MKRFTLKLVSVTVLSVISLMGIVKKESVASGSNIGSIEGSILADAPIDCHCDAVSGVRG
jgi:hypothetical protein